MDKREALASIFKSAELYRDNFLARNMLYFYGNTKSPEYMEVSFLPGNFHHLTGTVLKTKMSKADFFKRALSRRLSPDDFDFKHNGTTELKLEVLPLLLESKTSARMAGYYNHTRLYLHTERLVGGVYASMGFIKYNNNSSYYVPNTVDLGDIRKLIYQPKRLLAIYEKHYIEDNYERCIYTAKKIDPSKICFPKQFSYLGSTEIQISFSKKCLKQTEDRFEPGKAFYIITLPKGTILNGEDLSGCTIHPKEIKESENNPDEVVAIFRKEGSNPCYTNLQKEGLPEDKINVEELKIFIDEQREKEKEIQTEKFSVKDKSEEKDRKKESDQGEDI